MTQYIGQHTDNSSTAIHTSNNYSYSNLKMMPSMVSPSNFIGTNDMTSEHTAAGWHLVTTGNVSLDEEIISRAFLKDLNSTQFHILVPSLVLVVVLMVLGIPGNLIALMVYATKMKRSTAAYFIITLAMSDLINCCISLPIEIALISQFWTFDHPVVCKFSRFLTAAMNNTSSFILAAIAYDRFRSICLPLKPRISTLKAKVICIIITLCAVCSAIPMFIGYGTFTYRFQQDEVTIYGKTCLVDDNVVQTNIPFIILIYFFTGHLTVFFILVVLYSCIGYSLTRGSNFLRNEIVLKKGLLQRNNSTYSMTSFIVQFTTPSRNMSLESDMNNYCKTNIKLNRSMSTLSSHEMSLTRRHGGAAFRTKRMTCMLFLVTSVFEISFIPYLVIVSIRQYDPGFEAGLNNAGKMAFNFFLRFYLINSAVNPVIYCFYNQNFRHGVKRLYRSISNRVYREDMV
ncbi:cholecystokinin receptor type A-like [Dreissena polymorpha]|uniref:cholecystokinin receptor type A-like n=1 Tax=Dreissena polymorpha TaxID=45954 RepID=UPI002264EDA1|nr:cholecystokinin receptor type A-like [Dreissena polymorpha]XP_052274132.1 cholecystokinin receptor type A-like [Dreissena polymorpha]XP_052274133.1 cholecystokinin receptor type A-like [Dreissena polymorpha]XP_052274134.1 cholecystokinin receptor type A-like [Dreissena polymorpha]XP_052274135.1 cholecystokinin receptor type A-like [Dreissena polymorpha]